MIGNNLSTFEFELFTMVYALTAMHQLVKDKLLFVPILPPIIAETAIETLKEFHEKYPLPSYDMMADFAYKILETHNPRLSFSKINLQNLFTAVEVNNGYIL